MRPLKGKNFSNFTKHVQLKNSAVVEDGAIICPQILRTESGMLSGSVRDG